MSMQWFRVLSLYKYAMRVDEDVCVTYLPGVVGMIEAGAVYAYGVQAHESHEETVVTFLPWLREHMDADLLEPATPPLPTSEMYFTNFFLSNVAWWSQETVHGFLQSVHENGGIYAHRWG
eukprot:7383008-Prymnesium_polylepis.1